MNNISETNDMTSGAVRSNGGNAANLKATGAVRSTGVPFACATPPILILSVTWNL